jgi:hypothetical protein
MKNFGKQITIALVAALLVAGVGYALFSDTITVSGTATATGSMNVVVDSASATTSVGGGLPATNTATIAGDGNSVTLAVPSLQYPGASVTFTVVLKNTGNLGAKLTNITPTGLGTAASDLQITYSGIAANDVIAASNGTKTVMVTVTWNTTSSTAASAPFSIVFDFVQNTP